MVSRRVQAYGLKAVEGDLVLKGGVVLQYHFKCIHGFTVVFYDFKAAYVL